MVESAPLTDVSLQRGIGLSAPYLQSLQAAVAHVLYDTPCVVYLFGSRAQGTYTPLSDVDLAIASPVDLTIKLSGLRESLEALPLPLFVDVVDLNKSGATFAAQVKKEGIVIWKN